MYVTVATPYSMGRGVVGLRHWVAHLPPGGAIVVWTAAKGGEVGGGEGEK